ncbi:MAG: hypothetical protein ABEI54_00405 [Candidatus Bipolaricaulia bacterium]
MTTKKEKQARKRLKSKWGDFNEQKGGILARRKHGRSLSEDDVEQMFEELFKGPLGYKMWQVGRQQDYADRTLEGQGLKLAVVEVKSFRAFDNEDELESALVQAARYGDRHRTPNLIAFDGSNLVLTLRRKSKDDIMIALWEELEDGQTPPSDLFYFTHFGLFRYPKEKKDSFSYVAEEDSKLYRTHHGEKLHYTCYAHIGDLTSKTTWKLPYRNPDGSVDEKRLGHATNYLLSPGGYRGNLADEKENITEGDRFNAALKLAKAYKEVGKWREANEGFYNAEKPTPVQLLWRYLYQNGVEI